MSMKKAFSAFVVVSIGIYIFVLYYLLFASSSREMVVVSKSMLDNFNYWNSVNLVPFKTIMEYVAAVVDGSMRGHATRNLFGNLFLFFPVGFYLPFLFKKTGKIGIYSIIMAAVIIFVEITQLATMSGSLDIDDFILNFAGSLIGLLVFTRTPVRSLLKLRAW